MLAAGRYEGERDRNCCQQRAAFGWWRAGADRCGRSRAAPHLREGQAQVITIQVLARNLCLSRGWEQVATRLALKAALHCNSGFAKFK